MKCSRCKGELEEGMVVDHYGGGYKASKWAQRLKSGLHAAFAHAENEKEIKSYRCNDCGFLENYAK